MGGMRWGWKHVSEAAAGSRASAATVLGHAVAVLCLLRMEAHAALKPWEP